MQMDSLKKSHFLIVAKVWSLYWIRCQILLKSMIESIVGTKAMGENNQQQEK